MVSSVSSSCSSGARCEQPGAGCLLLVNDLSTSQLTGGHRLLQESHSTIAFVFHQIIEFLQLMFFVVNHVRVVLRASACPYTTTQPPDSLPLAASALRLVF